jgi:predicted nucleic acid-binding protein
METLGFNFKTFTDQELTEKFVLNSNIIGLSEDVINATIQVRKSKKIKLPDAIIAATAIANNLQLITQNTVDFKNIEGLQIIDLHTL